MVDEAFTPLGVPELERRIAADIARLSSAVAGELGASLAALVLGGGYGRGEGGGRRDAAGDWLPLNDYDLVAVVEGVPRRRLAALRRRLADVASNLERELQVEIELSPLRRQELAHLPFTMMWCELFAEPRVVFGNASALADRRALPPAQLPKVEAVRYLANRGALLLWCRLEPLPPERVWKFVHKAWLAAGAAALIAGGEFCVGYAARDRRLAARAAEALPPVPSLVPGHARAVRERLRPSPPPEALGAELEEATSGLLATWRWCEERRTGSPVSSWGEYAAAPGLFATPGLAAVGNLLRRLRARGEAPLWPPRLSVEPPWATVVRTLPAALAGEGLAAAARLLGCRAEEAAASVMARWRRFQA